MSLNLLPIGRKYIPRKAPGHFTVGQEESGLQYGKERLETIGTRFSNFSHEFRFEIWTQKSSIAWAYSREYTEQLISSEKKIEAHWDFRVYDPETKRCTGKSTGPYVVPAIYVGGRF